jgi:hypothetical protein
MIVFHNEEDQDSKVMLSDDMKLQGILLQQRDSSKLDFKIGHNYWKDSIIDLEYNSNLFRNDSMENMLNDFESVNSVTDLKNPIKKFRKNPNLKFSKVNTNIFIFVGNPLSDHFRFFGLGV